MMVRVNSWLHRFHPHRLQLTWLVAGVALLAALAPAVRGDEADDVKASARAFGQAVYKGDAAAARPLVVPSEASDKVVDGLAAMFVANGKFTEALKARFKQEASGAAGGPGARQAAGANALRWVNSIDVSDVTVDGDAATLQPPPIPIEAGRNAPGAPGAPAGTGPRPGAAGGQRSVPAHPIHLKKIDGKWRIDLAQLPGIGDDPARAARLLAAMARAYEETAAEVKDGKYRTPREADRAVGRKIFSAFSAGSGGAEGTAGPNTRPAPQSPGPAPPK